MESRKKKVIVGNWKMNPLTKKAAADIFLSIARSASRIKRTEIVLCPPFLYFDSLKKASKRISIGAQNAFWGDSGAFTGEISGDMLYNMGVKHVILGHSERRTLGETNEAINKKVRGCLAAGLRPILCVGETVRDAGHGYFGSVKVQLTECLNGIKKDLVHKVVIAYEPVWAISTTPDRKDATFADSLEMSIFIRKTLADKFGEEASRMKIIYGGKVDEKNAEEFLKNGGVDGLLVGKASLDAKKFSAIVSICEASEK